MVLKLDGFKGVIRPGEFFHIKPGSDYDPLLRRPLSIHRIGPKYNIIELLYRVVGKGTQLMSRRSRGSYLDVIGPLGNSFRISKNQSNFILAAGGMGIAPLMALCDELAKFRKRSITVILGAKTKASIICKDELKDLGAKVFVVTEDGSEGHKGVVSDMVREIIEKFDLRKTRPHPAYKNISNIPTIGNYKPQVAMYACGPIGMLKSIAGIAAYYRIETQASLEERMGCGLGACLGCVVRTKAGYKRVCKDGPVFNLDDIIWG
jgi:dihydroorotate dehydrogenase electron transfer subunit